MGELHAQVAGVLAEILVALLGLASAYLILYLRKATVKLREEAASLADRRQAELVWNAIDLVDSLAARTVEKIEQTTAGELRQAVKAGRVNRQELLALGRQAVEEVKRSITPEVEAALQNVIADLDSYLVSVIESKVREVKASTPALPALEEGDA